MKIHISFVTLLIMIFILTSCNEEINVYTYFDKKNPFNLKFYSTDSLTKFTNLRQLKILPNDNIYSNLTKWIDNNKTGWQDAPASYVPDVGIEQGTFHLLYLKKANGIVINFIDPKNIAKQYSKSVKKGELDFLYEAK
ncbi:MAG: hypothetical protein ABI666_09445 [Ferruginibacter sp.]